jgi:phenylacetate-CoA ligase
MTFDAQLAAVRGDVEGVAWPPLVTGRRAQLVALLHHLDRSQWLDPAVIAEQQQATLALFAAGTSVHAQRLLHGALVLRDHLWRAVDLGGRCAVVSEAVTAPVASPSWGRPFDRLFRTGARLVVPAAADTSAAAVRAFAPDVVAAPSRWLTENLGALDGVRWVRSTGPALAPDVRKRMRDTLGATVWEVYEPRGLGLVASECATGTGVLHVHAEAFIVEVLADDNRPVGVGQVGRVVVTVLRPVGSAPQRHETGALARVEATCPCGRGLPTLGREP